jgi:ABC-type transport system involved in multi-copper enzyme maturation permease subunit
MTNPMVAAVAYDLLRQAVARRWIAVLGIAITLALVMTGLFMRLDVVDGALAATRFFGTTMSRDVMAVDVALRPVFSAVSYLIVYGFSAFLILATADYAPSLLMPGRIEHLLALPVRRWELLAGTYVGVCTIAAMAAMYSAGGMAIVLGAKTGVWTLRPLFSGLLGIIGFAAIYAVMLTTAVIVRSAALSAAVGAFFYLCSIIAGYRDAISEGINAGWARTTFRILSGLVPRLSSLAEQSAHLASSEALNFSVLGAVVGAFVLFVAIVMASAVWVFERKDY